MNDEKSDLAAARKAKDMSQLALAKMVGVSQATISRIEKGEVQPDLRLWARLAKALDQQVRDLAPEDLLADVLPESIESFYAFCPNPFCGRNQLSKAKDGSIQVMWQSNARYTIERWSQLNFCARCGTELVKDCPGCGKVLDEPNTRFCVSCGKRITERPTADEWKKIAEVLADKADDDDIPF